ncbi:MAG: YqaA family protein [Pseudomonadota bacterium]
MTEWLTQFPVSLGGLFVASFLAATLLPGGSEALLFALLRLQPEHSAAALALATAGNTLGGMTTYWMARLLPQTRLPPRLELVRRHGSPILLLAWAPVVGDALCAAAGWLRVNWLASMAWMAGGKLLRYLLVAAAALQ